MAMAAVRQAVSYVGQEIAAPMVRISTLAFRLTALEYGADLVYSQETIDKKLLDVVRVENERLGTVEFYNPKGALVYQTCEAERGRNVMQIGTADPELALAAAKKVQHDVAAIDVNMGCPKHFSVHCGMGAGLLKTPDKAEAILENLVTHLDIPVTCKIRMLDSAEETLAFARRMEATGIKALGIHGRTTPMRPREPAIYDHIKVLAENLTIPVIANGDMFTRADVDKVYAETGCASVMFARGCMWNASLFDKSRTALAPVVEVARTYLRHCLATNRYYSNAKYTIGRMIADDKEANKIYRRPLNDARSMEELCTIFGMEDAWNAQTTYDPDYLPFDMEELFGAAAAAQRRGTKRKAENRRQHKLHKRKRAVDGGATVDGDADADPEQ